MAKISAKHFLNTNLKPYLINKEKHYSVYIALVAYRKNTKVKSIVLDEYYNENVFNEIVNSSDQYDIDLIENEINVITLITEIVTDVLKEFDTAFVTSYFKFSSMINIDSNLEYDKYLRENKINNVSDIIKNLDKYNDYFKVVETKELEKLEYVDFSYDFENKNEIRKELRKIEIETNFIEYITKYFESITIFDFFNKKNQNRLARITSDFINKESDNEFIFEYNKAIFINSLNRFTFYIRNTKNNYLIEKYKKVIDNAYNNKFL